MSQAGDRVTLDQGPSSRNSSVKWYLRVSQERRPDSARQSGPGRLGLGSQQVALQGRTEELLRSAGAAEDEAMTAVAERTKQSEVVSCEVRCAGTNEVLGYVVAGGSAGGLERALADNGLWLVPVDSRLPAARPVHTAA